ncbi:hypothetical protein NDU88_001436 [Pleurodeles waltl]|uniref:Uncharacterized protein n=1 Tax=Pleurodeles waltl TaxID=8319 RepID=A0AAV7LZB6_PLEWA|nr:hypothetical protein NDU88_001436 [Pleurodeles waltl]
MNKPTGNAKQDMTKPVGGRMPKYQTSERETVYRNPGSKFSLPLDPRPWTIIRHQGTLVVTRWGMEEIARNILAFRCYFPRSPMSRTALRGDSTADDYEYSAVNPSSPPTSAMQHSGEATPTPTQQESSEGSPRLAAQPALGRGSRTK